MKQYTGLEILRLPMQPNDAKAKTIGAYLVKLAAEVWEHDECFNGKRPFGNSSWDLEIIEALVLAEAIPGRIDSDGYVEDYDTAKANQRIAEAIAELEIFVGA